MFDFLRQWRMTEEEKRQEQLHAYLDGEMNATQRQRFEQLLAQDPVLRAELQQHQQIKAGLRTLPRVRVPRHFTLDPARYGAPAPHPAGQWYPVLRAATALTAIFLLVLVTLDVLGPGPLATTGVLNETASQVLEPAAEVAKEPAADADTAADETMRSAEESELEGASVPAATFDVEADDGAAGAVPEAAPGEGTAADEAFTVEAVEEEEVTAQEEAQVDAYPPAVGTPSIFEDTAETEENITAAQATDTANLPADTAAGETVAIPPALPEEEPVAAPAVPTLLVAEVAVGALLVVLVLVLLVVRRRL